MIVEQRLPKSIIWHRLCRIVVCVIKMIAIYLMLTMAYSFSFVFLIIMILIVFLCHKMAKLLENLPAKMVFTPLNQLKEGIVKVQGRADVKKAITAPLDNRLCIGYSHQVFDITSNGKLLLVKDEAVFNDFILFADGKHIEVNAEKIEFDLLMTEYLERDINNQKHIQKTLCQSDQVIIIADATLKNDGTYQLSYTQKEDKLIVQIKQNNESSKTKRKSRTYLPLMLFTACITISLLLMGYVGTDSHNQWAIFWTFDQLFFGHSFGLFNYDIAFYITLPECLNPIIKSQDVMPIALMIISSFIIFYALLKLSRILSRHGYFTLSDSVMILAIIILTSGIICLLSGFVLLLATDPLFFFRLVSIWIVTLSFGLLTLFISWIDNRLSFFSTSE